MKYTLLFWILASCLFTGCQDNIISSEDHYQVSFKATKQSVSNVATRATDLGFEPGDEIGIYVVRRRDWNTPVELKASGNYADNRRYVIDRNGNLQPYSEKDKIVISMSDVYDFYAYYPYNSELTDPNNYEFCVRNDQSTKSAYTASDFMLARNLGSGGKVIALMFERKMALLEMRFHKITGKNVSSAFVTTLKDNATLNFSTNESKTGTSTHSQIKMNLYEETGDIYIFRALLPTQEVKKDYIFDFLVNGNMLHYRSTSTTPLSAGERSIYYIMLQHKIETEVVTPKHGSVSGAGIYNHGSTVTLTASPDENYMLSGWYLSDGYGWNESLSLLSTNNPYSFTATESQKIFAKFEEAQYLINTVASDDEALLITPPQTVLKGLRHTVSVSPKYGYIFIGWYEDGKLVSPDSKYTFTVTRPRTLEARFRYEMFWITTTPAHAAENKGGTVLGGGGWMSGESCSVEAFPEYGYDFGGWYENGQLITLDKRYEFIVTCDRHLVANFLIQYHDVRIIVEGAPANMISGGSSGSYPSGTAINLTAKPTGDYYFNGWYEGSRLLTNSIYCNLGIWQARTITARFTKL